MGDTEIYDPQDRFAKGGESLIRNAEHQVGAQILKAALQSKPDALFYFRKAVNSAEGCKLLFMVALDAELSGSHRTERA